MSKSGPVIGAVAGMLLVVGGVAGAQAFKGEDTPAPKPSVVQPVVDVPEVTTTTATAAPEPAATTKAPEPVKVESSTSAPAKKAPAPKVQENAVADEPQPEQPKSQGTGRVVTNSDGSWSVDMEPGDVPPVVPANPGPQSLPPTPAG